MSALDAWRGEIRLLIPRGFLRRDQGDGLFISDFPRFPDGENVCAALAQKGYSVKIAGSMAQIDGTMEKYRALQQGLKSLAAPLREDDLPLFSLASRLIRENVPLEAQPFFWIRFTIKCLDEKKDEEIMRRLPGGIALLQRQRAPLPALAGALILDDLCYRMKGAEETC